MNWNTHTTALAPLVALLIAACGVSRLFASENWIELPTELKIGGVSVSIRAPLGLQYRPGETFPLEIQIGNPGAALDAELMAIEGGSADRENWAERGLPPAAIHLPPGTSRFTLPMRAPGVAANVALILRGSSRGGAKAELFRASLARVLRPLPSGGRVIVVCGGGIAPRGPRDEAVRVDPQDLFAEDWMWESVDWVIANDAAIKSAPPEARESLRRWLLGGGRLFLGSREAFAAALSLRLLPLDANLEIGADLNWWQKNAGLKEEDILASKNFRPVYARMRNGFGQIVFLFPGSNAADANGAEVFNRADLQRRRIALPDARVEPDRFTAFAPAAPSAPRRGYVMLWSALGALILCAVLLFAHSARTKIEAFLTPVVALAILVAMLSNIFSETGFDGLAHRLGAAFGGWRGDRARRMGAARSLPPAVRNLRARTARRNARAALR